MRISKLHLICEIVRLSVAKVRRANREARIRDEKVECYAEIARDRNVRREGGIANNDRSADDTSRN